MSEVQNYRKLVLPFITGVNVIDIGSQGDPITPSAIQVELPAAEFEKYSGGSVLEQAGVWRGDGRDLPFKDGTVDTVFSSHLIEDFEDWTPALKEWDRVLKKGGNLIVLTPDDDLFNAAVAGGQTPNCAHRHCGHPGEISQTLYKAGLKYQVIQDALTKQWPGDYSILFIGTKA